MIAVDTNILVYSTREDSAKHTAALAAMVKLAESEKAWAIPWPCLHEFLAVVTHPGIYKPSTPMKQAIDQVQAWMESSSLRLIGEQAGYWDHLQSLLSGSQVQGPKVHEARIAAICRSAGVREIWTADRDFSRFPGLIVRNPLT